MTPAKNEIYFWDYALSQLPERLPSLISMYEDGIFAGMEAVESNSDIFKVTRPKAGMFLWIEVPTGISTCLALEGIIEEYLIAYAPGLWFQPRQVMLTDGTILGPEIDDNKMRVCVVTEEPEIVKESLNTLAHAFRAIARENNVSLFTEQPDSNSVEIYHQVIM